MGKRSCCLTALRFWALSFLLLPIRLEISSSFPPPKCFLFLEPNPQAHVEEQAQRANSLLLQLLHETKEPYAIGEFLDTVTSQFSNKSVLSVNNFFLKSSLTHSLSQHNVGSYKAGGVALGVSVA